MRSTTTIEPLSDAATGGVSPSAPPIEPVAPELLYPSGEATMMSVAMLRWPGEEGRRLQLEAAHAPRLLIIGPDEPAPPLADDLEDWLRDPPNPADLMARLSALSRRAKRVRQLPHLDGDGLLWSDGRWAVIPDTQLCIVELLLAHANELVSTGAITTTYVRSGSSGHRASVRTMLNRLVGRFAQVGLELHLVRGKGVILEVPGR